MGYETIKFGRSLTSTYNFEDIKREIANEIANYLIDNNRIIFTQSEVEGFHVIEGRLDISERTIGRWLDSELFHYSKCSVCGRKFCDEMFYDQPQFRLCPWCGAIMENGTWDRSESEVKE